MPAKSEQGREVIQRLLTSRGAEKYLYPLLLLVYPLLLIHQGVDITDTTYSLGYYRFMEEMDLTWVLATWLANVAGAALRKLPMGDTLLGMNLYTSLILAGIALLTYYGLSRWLSRWLVFLGEVIALSLCWCPTTILYNYLTYLLFALGGLLLYRAVCEEDKRYFVAAGLCLGVNVWVRFSNLAEAGLIVVVWYAGWLKREKLLEIGKKTGLCLVGYLAGMGSILWIIGVKYGREAFPQMVQSLFGMTKEASDYTLAGMLMATADAYWVGIKWMAWMIPCVGAGLFLFWWKKGRYEGMKKLLYCLGIPVLLRFYWARGMFSFRYYNEGCIFQWMMLFLILTIICCIYGIFGRTEEGKSPQKDQQERILAVLVLMIVLLTPLGSNNYTYQNMNNLFLVAPYTLWSGLRILNKTRGYSLHFPWQSFLVLILLMTFAQGLGFGCRYVFRDGIHGEARDTQVENSSVLEGMYTNRENAQGLSELLAFCQEENVGEQPVLLWGNAPGLSYILDTPSAIFTTWPEIPSNTTEALAQALEELAWKPDVILHYETGKSLEEGKKSELILDFLKDGDYGCIFENRNYKVYRAAGQTNQVSKR
ncbi:MAG: hypothetical protein IKM28_10505 [Lachnospiraceae bacterium]|nr:hypothetical protein [Lachnospiraceae bacterium]